MADRGTSNQNKNVGEGEPTTASSSPHAATSSPDPSQPSSSTSAGENPTTTAQDQAEPSSSSRPPFLHENHHLLPSLPEVEHLHIRHTINLAHSTMSIISNVSAANPNCDSCILDHYHLRQQQQQLQQLQQQRQQQPQTPGHSTSSPRSNSRPIFRFQPNWLELYDWLRYDEDQNHMYCVVCRRWSNDIPDIRTSFSDGNTNFRVEILNHHDKSNAHKLCKERDEREQRKQ